MTNAQIQQIAITSAIAAAAGGVVSAFVTYFVSRALEQQYGAQIQSRVTEAVRALRHPSAVQSLSPLSGSGRPRYVRRGF